MMCCLLMGVNDFRTDEPGRVAASPVFTPSALQQHACLHYVAACHNDAFLLHRQRGMQRALFMILVRDRSAEQRENAVAGGLDDVSVVPMDRVDHQLQCGMDIARASSGSRSSINSVEPLMSANSAVTVLRSPSSGSRPSCSGVTRISGAVD